MIIIIITVIVARAVFVLSSRPLGVEHPRGAARGSATSRAPFSVILLLLLSLLLVVEVVVEVVEVVVVVVVEVVVVVVSSFALCLSLLLPRATNYYT